MNVMITNGDGVRTKYDVNEHIDKLTAFCSGDIEIEESVDVIKAHMETMQNLLHNAIVGWYDNNLYEYCGIDDEAFITHVCKTLELSRAEYNEIMGIEQ